MVLTPSKTPFTAVVPDYRGAWLMNDGPLKFREDHPESRLVVVVNGPLDDWQKIEDRMSYASELTTIISNTGLRNALEAGYQVVFARDWSTTTMPILRCDTAEHPTELAHVLAAIANTGALAYVDLEFPAALGHMPKHELDADLRYRDLVRHITKNKLEAGGAHGFLALPPQHADDIVIGAMEIMRIVDREIGESAQWGFDLACILTTHCIIEAPVIRIPWNGITQRDREQNVCDEQYSRAVAVARAAYGLWGKVSMEFPPP